MSMGSISYHAGKEGKITRNNVKGMSGHTMRNSKDGYKNHSNEEIDTSLTKYNIDWTRDKIPLHEMVEDRLENEFKGQRKLRKDAVVIREIIAQPPPELFEGLSMKEKREKAVGFTNDSLVWFAKEFGSKNVLALSLHLDETNPHMHVSVMPMTSDGRISQKDFFKGPKDLKRQHREYREHMVKKGWDIDLENKYENIDGLALPKYKANAKDVEVKRQQQQQMIQELREVVDVRSEALQLAYEDVYPQAKKKAYEDAYREQSSETGNAYRDAYSDVHDVLLQDARDRVDKERKDREDAQVERERVEKEQQARRKVEEAKVLAENRRISERFVREEGMVRPDKVVPVALIDACTDTRQELKGKQKKTLKGGFEPYTTYDIYRKSLSKYQDGLKLEREGRTVQQSHELER